MTIRKFSSDDYELFEGKFVDKVWGYEEQIVNDSLGYCGKKLVVKPRCACSIHFHRLKTETFYVKYGELKLALFKRDFSLDEALGGIKCHVLLGKEEAPPDAFLRKPEFITLGRGQALHLPPFIAHCFWNVKVMNAVFFEFSTNDREDDSYRIKPSVARFEGDVPDLSF